MSMNRKMITRLTRELVVKCRDKSIIFHFIFRSRFDICGNQVDMILWYLHGCYKDFALNSNGHALKYFQFDDFEVYYKRLVILEMYNMNMFRKKKRFMAIKFWKTHFVMLSVLVNFRLS